MRINRFGSSVFLALGIVAVSGPAFAGPITAGNLVVYRVGTGSGALNTTATAVFLDEYTTTGTLVQSIAVSTTGSSALTAVGNANTEGIISVSQDGTSLVFGGYRKNTGTTNPSSDAPATTNRVIGTVGLNGVVNTSVAITNTTGTIRSATTVDGSSFYVGTSALVGYVASPGASSTSTTIDARNSRQVNVVGNTLFASNGSTAVTNKVQSYGTLPTTTTTPTSVVSLLTADAVHGFYMADLNPLVPGVDTVYALSTVENLLRKYSFDGTSWTARGSIAAASAQNITAIVTGTTIDLYVTSTSSLRKLTDSSGSTGTLTGTTTAIATASTNTGFRGLGSLAAVVSAPEPTSLALLALGGFAPLVRRRRK